MDQFLSRRPAAVKSGPSEASGPVLTLVCVGRTKEKTTKDDIVVEMKSNTKNEEAVLLKAVNGDKKGPNNKVTIVADE